MVAAPHRLANERLIDERETVLTNLRLIGRLDVDEHRRLVRFTLPVWLYVSVTGVVVYVMLYHVAPAT